MAFQECVIEVAQDQAEAWSDALFDLGALSVSVEDADADTPDEQPLFGEPGLEPTKLAWNRSRVVALFGDDTDPVLVVAAASNALGIAPVPAYELREVEDQDWVRLTQSQFERSASASASGSCRRGMTRPSPMQWCWNSTRAWPSAPAAIRPRGFACSGSSRT